jgi:hypothetical protein
MFPRWQMDAHPALGPRCEHFQAQPRKAHVVDATAMGLRREPYRRAARELVRHLDSQDRVVTAARLGDDRDDLRPMLRRAVLAEEPDRGLCRSVAANHVLVGHHQRLACGVRLADEKCGASGGSIGAKERPHGTHDPPRFGRETTSQLGRHDVQAPSGPRATQRRTRPLRPMPPRLEQVAAAARGRSSARRGRVGPRGGATGPPLRRCRAAERARAGQKPDRRQERSGADGSMRAQAHGVLDGCQSQAT